MAYFIITLILSLSIIGYICYRLIKHQENFIKTLKVGDEISIQDMDGEILEKVDDIYFIVKVKVSGMRLSKPIVKTK